jgi:outer membrane protein
MPEAPLPQPDTSTVDLRNIAPLSRQPGQGAKPSTGIQQAEDSKAEPRAESPSPLKTHWFDLVGAYHPPHVPELSLASPLQIDNLVHDGKLYLSLHDAIVLAIENNLDVEVSRYDLLLADTDLTRAQGGGNLRGVDYTLVQPPPGVGAATTPLLITSTNTGAAAPTGVNVIDLSQVTQIGTGAQSSLSENGTSTYSPGPAIPLFDPVLTGSAGYLRRSDQTSLINTGTTGSMASGTSSSSAPLDFVSAGLDYQQGFSTGAQLEVYADNAAQVLYAANSQYDPFYSPSTSITLTQPLLRGRGRAVNLRFIRIAQLDRKVSRLVFEQQLLETVYGISRLYYDLFSLGENVGVKQEALDAAQKLYEDDKNQVDQGTLAPIELTRSQALLSGSRLDLIQAEGEYRQEEVILREQLVRQLGTPGDIVSIVPTDRIVVPDTQAPLDVPALIADALANRPDITQAALQIQASEIAENAARNNVKPLLGVYANVQTRGSSLVPYEPLGSNGTGVDVAPAALFEGGLRLSTIYQAGVQLNMPLRNRIAQADSARDAIQLRQAQGRTAKLENDIRQQIENAAIALDTAHQAYAAAVQSRDYQQQLLQAEIDKFSVGESTNFLIVQDEAYLAQARSTEVAARSDWIKAKLALDRSMGSLLEVNHIQLDDAIENAH